MRSWNLLELEVPEGSRSPIVLHSDNDARAVLIGLNPGQELGDHQVLVAGRVEVGSGEESIEADAGTLFRFDANERHRVASREGARILLLLAPWPGAGHYRGSR